MAENHDRYDDVERRLRLLNEAVGILPAEQIAARACALLDSVGITAPQPKQDRAGAMVIDITHLLPKHGTVMDDTFDPILAFMKAGPAEPLLEHVQLAEFLARKGYTGPELPKLIVPFQRAVKVEYVRRRGDYPPKRQDADGHLVDWYEGPDDVALVEHVYREQKDAIEAEAFGPRTA